MSDFNKRIRDRAVLYLSPEVASCASMTLAQLEQFVAGYYWPSEAQLRALARRLHLAERGDR